MTREEALYGVELYSYFENDIEVLNKDDVIKLVNQIYDNFQKWICKNCAWFNDGKCVNPLGTLDYEDENFGCNRFEKIEEQYEVEEIFKDF